MSIGGTEKRSRSWLPPLPENHVPASVRETLALQAELQRDLEAMPRTPASYAVTPVREYRADAGMGTDSAEGYWGYLVYDTKKKIYHGFTGILPGDPYMSQATLDKLIGTDEAKAESGYVGSIQVVRRWAKLSSGRGHAYKEARRLVKSKAKEKGQQLHRFPIVRR